MTEKTDWQGRPLVDYSRQSTPRAPDPEAMKATANPWASPPKETILQGTVIPPADPDWVPVREAPYVAAKARDGSPVSYCGRCVGRVENGRVVLDIFPGCSPEASAANIAIHAGRLTKLVKGELE